ncbi:hypothetical protein [Candidatus Albibeggiatoa sp. nov. NOAA]|uniref:hypothetical protein n=1 Tax=Candidatus Albibeggiatoa sp. nov. NOAA TaxID=3162724 RepID=UPI003304A127|nr:hypothetical protein [Thiotrichaceae bacterium]
MSVPPLATNVDDAYRVCNPEQPLKADDTRYVDLTEVRGMKNFADTITKRIIRTAPAFHKQLITGHRGCGKSTEILRLKQKLERKNFFAIYIDVEEILDLGEVDYLDVLLAIARQTEQSIREHDLQMDAALLQGIYDWFAEKIITKEKKHDVNTKMEAKASAGLKIPLVGELFSSLTGDIQSGSSQREVTRENLERQQAEFFEYLNALIHEARRLLKDERGFEDIVILVDGLEKMQYRLLSDEQSTHAVLFVHHAEQLKAPDCHIVYTVPVSLAFQANLGAAFPEGVMLMPMVKYMKPEGEQALMEIIQRRVDVGQVFETEDLLKRLVHISGGAVRDLMRLMRLATEGGEQIGQMDVQQAVNTVVREYDRLVRNKDIETLRFVQETKRVPADEEYARLLNHRLILEYQNGERWADLHPALLEISWIQDELNIQGEK